MRKQATVAAIALSVLVAYHHTVEGRRLVPYRDLAGNLTVCKGHTGPDVVENKSWTAEQCDAQDRADSERAIAEVIACTGGDLPPGPQIGFGDLGYNTGSDTYCRSSMPRLYASGKVREACAKILGVTYVWVPVATAQRYYAPIRRLNPAKTKGLVDCRTAGHLCPGILARRQWEYEKCVN